MAVTATISAVTQLTTADGIGSEGDIKVTWSFSGTPASPFMVTLEYEWGDVASPGFITVRKHAGVYGSVATQGPHTTYWLDPKIDLPDVTSGSNPNFQIRFSR